MAQYQYAKTDGSLGTFDAADDTAAGQLASSQAGADPRSGASRYAPPSTSGNSGGAPGSTNGSSSDTSSETTYGLRDRYSNERQRIDTAFGVLDQPDEKAVRETYQARAQAAVNAVNSKYASIEASDRSQVDLMNREERASNLMNGLSGGSVGSARTIDTANEGKALQDRTARQKETEVTAILTDAETRSTEEFQREREAYLSQQKNRFAAEQALFEKIGTAAQGELKALAGKYSFEEFKKANPKLVKQYQEELDTDENGLKAAFLTAQEGELLSKTPEIVGGKAIWFTQGADGTIKQTAVDLPKGAKEIESSRITDSGIQVLYKDGTYEVIAAAGLGGENDSNNGSNSDDSYTEADAKRLRRAGLANADLRTRQIYIDSPENFKDEFARNASGSTDTTPENILHSLDEWEKIHGDTVETPDFGG